MRLLGHGLDVDVLSGQQVECRGYAGGRGGDAGSGDRSHRVDVFFESWRDREVGQRRDLRHDIVWLVGLRKAGVPLHLVEFPLYLQVVRVLQDPLSNCSDVVQPLWRDRISMDRHHSPPNVAAACLAHSQRGQSVDSLKVLA